MVEYDFDSLDWSNTEQLKQYYMDTAGEGYLAAEEEKFGDKLFSELEELRTVRESVDELVVELVSNGARQ